MKQKGRPKKFEHGIILSINFEKRVLDQLNEYCKINKLERSNLINKIIEDYLETGSVLDIFTDLNLEYELLRRSIIHQFGEIPDINLSFEELQNFYNELEKKYY